MRLTADLILTSPAFVNTLKDRELDLRGHKIAVIENLGATKDGFDLIDLSDNEIKRLGGFPVLRRLSQLFLHNNSVARIAGSIGQRLPNLDTLILTNNKLSNLGDLDPLASCKKLRSVSLIGNPVANKQHYRLYLIHILPSLRVIDFRKVKPKEKRESRKMFSGDEGVVLSSELGQKTFEVDEGASSGGPSKDPELEMLLSKVTDLDELQTIHLEIQTTGKLSKATRQRILGKGKEKDLNDEEMEEA